MATTHDAQPLSELLEQVSKDIIGTAFFQSDYLPNDNSAKAFDSFFKYYDKEIEWLTVGESAANDQTIGVVLETHNDVATAVKALRKGLHESRSNIRSSLRQQFHRGEEEGLNRSIDIAARLWSMVNVKEAKYQRSTERPPLQWNDQTKLCDFFTDAFPPSKVKLNARESRLSPFFTVAFMVDVCGLNIEWTNSLDNHLFLDRQTKTLWIFPYKRVLAAYLMEYDVSGGKRWAMWLTVMPLKQSDQLADHHCLKACSPRLLRPMIFSSPLV